MLSIGCTFHSLGSYTYMYRLFVLCPVFPRQAPELLRDGELADSSIDMFALGVMVRGKGGEGMRYLLGSWGEI